MIPEESEVVLKALKRLSPKESYDRVFRMRRAFQVNPTTIESLAGRKLTVPVLAVASIAPQGAVDQARGGA